MKKIKQELIDKFADRMLIDYPEKDKVMLNLYQFAEEIINLESDKSNKSEEEGR